MRPAALLLALAAALAVATPGHAAPGRIAVGLAAGALPGEVAARLASVTGGTVAWELEPLGALVVAVDDREAALAALADLSGIDYVEPVTRTRRLVFQPNDPLALFQWYLSSIRAFDFWETMPSLPPVRVAVIDSGIDGSHPEFEGRVASTRTFVTARATVDTVGHGTMVAGEIAAALDNAVGIAGVGFPVQLLVAKVVAANGTISVEDEASAIRWAVDNGARVINLSLGGRRDPRNPARDTYSRLEQAAVNYAFQNGVAVVAATGNCENVCPYGFASYPAALPHVIGVSALTQAGPAAVFSNRDAVFNDVGAPGTGVVSTFPIASSDPDCPNPGYSICALSELRSGNGTSFAAPLVSAAVALLMAELPTITPSQAMKLIEESAVDIGVRGRDAQTGNGRLDVAGALRLLPPAFPLPPADGYETNDDAGRWAWKLYGARRTVDATIDYFDDPSDVYRTRVVAGQRLTARLVGPRASSLVLWRPSTKHVTAITQIALRSGAILAYRQGASVQLSYRAPSTGWYYLQVKATKRGEGAYRLSIAKS